MIVWVLCACAGAAGAIVVAEWTARLVLRLGHRYCVHGPGRRWELDLDPGVSPHMDRHVSISVNSAGERGDEVDRRARDVFRIAVVGGSSTYCYLIDQPKTWPEKMGTYLREMGLPARLGRSRLHVGNLGQAELTAGGARLIVDRVLARDAGLDAVVLMLGISDVLRWLRYGAPARLAAQPASDVFAIHPEGPYAWKPRATALAEVWRRLRSRWELWRTPVVSRRNVGRSSLMAARASKQKATTMIDEVPDPTPMLARFRADLSAILGDLRARGLGVLVLGPPHFDSASGSDFERSQFWNGGIGDPTSHTIATYYSDRVLDQLSDLVNAAAGQVAEASKVAFVNLNPIVPSDLRYYYDQIHFTPAGADLVARAAADGLVLALCGPELPRGGSGPAARRLER